MYLWLIILLVILGYLSLIFLFLLLWKTVIEFRKAQDRQAEVSLAQIELVKHSTSLLAAGDVLSYQQIRLMDNPSQEALEPSSISDEETEMVNDTPPSDERANELYDKHLRGEEFTDDEARQFERIFAHVE